jgi:hypothetical protein
MLLLITERLWEVLAYQCYFQGGHVGVYSVFFKFQSIQRICVSKTRLRRRECPTSTSRFVQMITIILLSTRALDLNLAMPRACELSGILSRTVLIRAVHLRKDCMPSGREVMLKLLVTIVWLISLNPGYVSPHLMLSVGASERVWRRS